MLRIEAGTLSRQAALAAPHLVPRPRHLTPLQYALTSPSPTPTGTTKQRVFIRPRVCEEAGAQTQTDAEALPRVWLNASLPARAEQEGGGSALLHQSGDQCDRHRRACCVSCVLCSCECAREATHAWRGRRGGAHVTTAPVVLVAANLLVNDEIVWAAVAVAPRAVARIALERNHELRGVPARLVAPGAGFAAARRERCVLCAATQRWRSLLQPPPSKTIHGRCGRMRSTCPS